MGIFETSLEKISRLMAQQWGINVVFEGTEAKTDGKTITLPAHPDLSEKIIQDLNSLLDAQVARVKYTNFNLLNKAFSGKGKAFSEQLFKAAEQSRAEKMLVQNYPGCKYNLDPLNNRMRQDLQSSWKKLPWPVRAVHSIRDALEGRKIEFDDDIKDILTKINPLVEELKNAKSTSDVRLRSEEITQQILDYLDDSAEDSNPSQQDDSAEDSNPSQQDEQSSSSSSDSDSEEGEASKDASQSQDSGSDSDEGGEGSGKSAEADESQSEAVESSRSSKDQLQDAKQEMFDDASAWQDYNMSTDDLINDEIKTEIAPGGGRPQYGKALKQHIPATTRFDLEIDWTAQGDHAAYAAIKQSVQEHVSPIKRSLEKSLKVIENARWRQERERGQLNTRSLARLVSEPGYRKPFKELTKTEVNNVAIQILIDMSGSMGGRMQTATATAVVLAEALRELNITFEVTGFHSEYSSQFASWSRANNIDSRFNRQNEALHKYIFKNFDSLNLTGITKLYVGSQNPDGEGVRWAASRLSKQKAKRKILFVLSDGAPAAEGDCSILAKDLKLAVEQISKHGIEVVGVGIQTTHVKEYYPDFIVVNKISDLPSETMNKLSKLILKGVPH